MRCSPSLFVPILHVAFFLVSVSALAHHVRQVPACRQGTTTSRSASVTPSSVTSASPTPTTTTTTTLLLTSITTSTTTTTTTTTTTNQFPPTVPATATGPFQTFAIIASDSNTPADGTLLQGTQANGHLLLFNPTTTGPTPQTFTIDLPSGQVYDGEYQVCVGGTDNAHLIVTSYVSTCNASWGQAPLICSIASTTNQLSCYAYDTQSRITYTVLQLYLATDGYRLEIGTGLVSGNGPVVLTAEFV